MPDDRDDPDKPGDDLMGTAMHIALLPRAPAVTMQGMGKMGLFDVMACSIEAFRTIEEGVLDGNRQKFHPGLAKERNV